MYHGGSSSNGSTTYPFVGVPVDYPYGLTPAPLMDSAPAVDQASDVCWSFEQAQNWTITPASPTVTLSPLPIPRYREIRPRPLHESASTLPPVQPGKEEQHSQYRNLRRKKTLEGPQTVRSRTPQEDSQNEVCTAGVSNWYPGKMAKSPITAERNPRKLRGEIQPHKAHALGRLITLQIIRRIVLKLQ